MIGHRIKQARLGANLTLKAMGDAVGVSHTAIQKYELGKVTPSSSQLLKLARASGVRTEYFFRSNQVELVDTEFRKRASFGLKAQEAVKLKVEALVEKRIELLGVFPQSPIAAFEVPDELPDTVDTYEDIECLVESMLNAWQMGLNPIQDLTHELESRGLLVVMVDEPNEKFCGLSAKAVTASGTAYPVVAVSSTWPGDRQRFTLAHELGHLVLHDRLPEELDEERACNRFAGAFLVPRFAVLRALGAERRRLEVQELKVLKHEFGLSMAGWLMRAKQCGVISDDAYSQTWRLFSSQGWRTKEPGEPLAKERPKLFEQLVYRALAEQFVSEAKAAELLDMSLMRFCKERMLESHHVDAHQ